MTESDTAFKRAPISPGYAESIRIPVGQLVALLQATLGTALVAHICGVSDRSAISEWAAGTRAPRIDAETRIRLAYRVVATLQATETDHTIRPWFIGLNPMLDEAPAEAILKDRERDVLMAAQAFTRL